MNELVFICHTIWVSMIAYACRKQSLVIQTALMITFAILGNLMLLKQMMLFGFAVTTSDVYAVGVILVLNFIREAYDDKAVHQAMIYSFGALAIFAIAAYFQLLYDPLVNDMYQPAYVLLMHDLPRKIMVSAVVYFVVQYIDNQLFSWMKQRAGSRWLTQRVLLSLVFSQVLDTVLFTVFALGDIAQSKMDIIIFSSCVKVICSSAMVMNTAITNQVIAWIKR